MYLDLDNKKMTVLVLAPHTDDGELGCGGSISKFVEEGHDVYYAAFSLCEESVSPEWPKNILEDEVRKATKVLGIKEDNLLIYRYKVRHFFEKRQDILEDLVELQKRLKPNIVFLPSQRDLHQDHQIIANEGRRAFKQTTILAYEMPWNNIEFSTQVFIKLNKNHINKKIKALSKYKSQLHKSYATKEFINSLCHTRAVSIGSEYAEAFELVRWVIE